MSKSATAVSLSGHDRACLYVVMALLCVTAATGVTTAIAARNTENRIGDIADRFLETQALEGLADAAKTEAAVSPALRQMVGGLFDLYVHMRSVVSADTLDNFVRHTVDAAAEAAKMVERGSKVEKRLEGVMNGAMRGAADALDREGED